MSLSKVLDARASRNLNKLCSKEVNTWLTFTSYLIENLHTLGSQHDIFGKCYHP